MKCCCLQLQGVDGWDVDLPTMLEANYITSFVAKVLWVFVYIAVYGLRPVIIRPKPIGETPASSMALCVLSLIGACHHKLVWDRGFLLQQVTPTVKGAECRYNCLAG